jgi:hypothetical protein
MKDNDTFPFFLVGSVMFLLLATLFMVEYTKYKKHELNTQIVMEYTANMNPQSVCFNNAKTNEQFEICKSMTPQ